METTSSSLPRVRGMLDSLIECCDILQGCHQAFATIGITPNHFTHRLLTLQSCLPHIDSCDPQQPSFSNVIMDLSYDLETLFEDIHLQQHMASSYSSDPTFWSQFLATQQQLVHQGSSILYGTSHRLASMLKLIDQLVSQIKPSSSSISLPHTPSHHVIVQKPQIGNNYYGLKQLIDENEPPSSSVGFHDNHACLIRCNYYNSLCFSSLRRGFGFLQCSTAFRDLKLPPSWKDLGFPWYLKQCVEFYNFASTNFPSRPNKETMLLLWIAEGFVQQTQGTSLEDEASQYFDALLQRGDIENQFNHQFPIVPEGFFCFDNSNGVIDNDNLPQHEHHVCMPCFSDSHMETISNLPNSDVCRSLFVFSQNYNHSSNTHLEDHHYHDKFMLPSILFLKLTNLRVLILYGIGFSIVPDYIFGLLHLRYLDLSNNPLKELPDSLANLLRLQTLKILQTYIKSVPKNLYKMANLRHLCADSGTCFEFVPPYIGRLVSLQTFEDFAVIRQNGCRITELKDLNNLHGKLCIRQLENVKSSDEAQQARLYLKKHLTWLRLCWSESGILDVDVNFDVIEFLQPHHNLQLLEIYGYLNSTFPSWISDPSFKNLSSITLEECVCEQLPEFGVLPSLKSLRISVVTGVDDIYESFYGHGKVKVGFPSLCTLVTAPSRDEKLEYAK
ncbi:hypothetical protein PIB30_038741 [Stylosanthes scabra]|uniref:Uncharacterized protein n=1 Tax=Stylosanthes scabra TaxID=79078 RepID=A0ABU6UCR3_9FABA|nr:hypothetical protein [Stylosanthes scabra]